MAEPTDRSDGEHPGFRVTDRRHWAQEDAPNEEVDAEERKPSYVEGLESQLRAAEAKVVDTVSRHQAAVQEFERARGRIEREAQRRGRAARMEFLRSFLPVLDDVDRAVEAAATSDGPPTLRDGYALIQRRFTAVLAEHGVQRIDAAGAPFDPSQHEAVAVRETDADDDDGRVVEVLSPGYRAGDEVLRPARVAVAKLSSSRTAART